MKKTIKNNQTYIRQILFYFFIAIITVLAYFFLEYEKSLLMSLCSVLLVTIYSIRQVKLYESMNEDYNSLLNELYYNLKENELLIETLKSQREDLITSKKEVYDMAYYDNLTTLPKKEHFQQYVSHRMGHIKEAHILKADIKDFKLINSVYGSQMADKLIQTFGRVIKDINDPSLYTCRYSSDEFLFWYESNDLTLMKNILNKAMLEYQVRCRQFFSHFNVSFHLAYINYPEDGQSYYELVDKLSIAMKYTKETTILNGLRYKSTMSDKLQYENKLRQSIEDALGKRTFEVYFQEKNDVNNYVVVGLEALARLNDSDLGQICPDDFMPLIHKYHYTESFERQIIGKVFSIYHELLDKYGSVSIGINVSPSHVISNHFYKYFSDALNLYRIDLKLIKLEIAEDILTKDLDDTIEKLNALRDLGVKITIDNFGSRYSSLNHLVRLPFDELKVDRSFVKDIGDDKVQDILRFIINFEKKYGIDVIVSGVESDEELEILRNLGFSKIQGFLYQIPEPIGHLKGAVYSDSNIS